MRHAFTQSLAKHKKSSQDY